MMLQPCELWVVITNEFWTKNVTRCMKQHEFEMSFNLFKKPGLCNFKSCYLVTLHIQSGLAASSFSLPGLATSQSLQLVLRRILFV